MTTSVPPSPPRPPTDIRLPAPANLSGASLAVALQDRRTRREASERPLPDQQLSNLLWAALGVNRPTGPFGQPGRTAASASNSQEIEIYVALEQGVYLYDAIEHRLSLAADGDLRGHALTPGQPAAAVLAPVHLVYVVDIRRLSETRGFVEPGLKDPEIQKSYYFVDVGLIAGNVYLFAAAEDLAAWFHNCDRAFLSAALGLPTHQRVLFAQSVGYPA